MKNSCNIVRDLLPLYAEGLASAESCAFVEEHLAGCPECRAELEDLRRAPAQIPKADVVPLKKLRRELRVRRAKAIAFTIALVTLALTCVFAQLTARSYLPYEEGLVHIEEWADGGLIVTFDESVGGYAHESYVDAETGRRIHYISAWDSLWNRFSPARSAQVLALMEPDAVILYAPNDGGDCVLLRGEMPGGVAGVSVLPRLTLGYYLILAAALAAVLLALRLLLHRNKRLRRTADQLLIMPLTYILGHLLVNGLETTTYSPEKDFFLILLAALSIYCAVLLGQYLWRVQKMRGNA